MQGQLVSRNPLYNQIRQIMLDEIRRGVWTAGEKLPTESALARRFGTSVGTVRRAMGGLEDEGIITRKEGSGTFVRSYRETGCWNQFHLFTDLDGKPRGSRKELISLKNVVAPDFVADAMRIEQKTPLLLMVRKLWGAIDGEEKLITVDESYLLPERFVGLTCDYFELHFRPDDSLYKFYDREFGVVIIRQKCKVRFERVRPETADRLEIERNAEVLRTERLSFDITKQPIEYRINRGRLDCTQVSFDVMG